MSDDAPEPGIDPLTATPAVRQAWEEAAADAANSEGRLRAIRAARRDEPSDDEHDPEGPTLAFEWSMAEAALHAAEQQQARADAALGRIADGSYGICIRCGRAIAAPRLAARPLEELCIDCARDVEEGHA